MNLGGLGLYRKFVIPIIGENSKSRLRRKLLKKMPKNAICAELGVMDGFFSKEILKITRPKKLVLIDIWSVNQTFTDPIPQSEYDLKYDSVKEKFKSRLEVEIIKGRTDIIKTFPDNYFDWVYIDANHRYEAVKNDLDNCYSKIKHGGYIIGDDYSHENYKDMIYGVIEAVDEFVATHNLDFNSIDTQFIIKLDKFNQGELM